ncbi:MAG: hypothetical protein ABEK42_10040 [Thiohalorhabdaceae bacterium]
MLHTNRMVAMLGATVLLAWGAVSPASADEVTEMKRSLKDLPQEVSSTMEQELGQSPKEVEEIRYEGIVVLYEAEYPKGGEMYEVYVRPNGKLAEKHEHSGEAEKQKGH